MNHIQCPHTDIYILSTYLYKAYILPLQHISASGVALDSLDVTRYDRDVGKHGDTALGHPTFLQP
jgi:hypothetical protein